MISLCSDTLWVLGKAPSALTVVFVDSCAMRVMNGRYRGRDYPTDVLSFLYGCEADDGLAFLGDVVISPEVACRNAERWHAAPDREIRKLLVHGVLHLLGHDHEIDSGEMNRLQRRLLRRKFFLKALPVIALQTHGGASPGRGTGPLGRRRAAGANSLG